MAHIAWLGKKSPFCGNVTYGLSTTEALRQRGHAVSFIHFDTPTTGLGLLEPARQEQERPDDSPAPGGGPDPDVALPYLVKSQVYTIPSPGAQRELRESLERLRPDLVHASLTLSPLDFRLPDLCQQLGLPLVATFHPAFDAGLRNLAAGTQQLTYQLYAPSLARYDRVIVFSELQAEVLQRLGVPANRLAVIPNGVDTELWRPAPAAASPELLELRQRFTGRRVFLYVGRVATEKNVEALLKAWRLVRPAGCVLVVVGDGPLRGALQQSGGGEADVVWWGYE
ncbi:MAG: glycosyltransferase family 4 protein, partial [Synechococcaceae cyanobacterium]